MNITFNLYSRYTLSLFNEPIRHSLTSLSKRVGWIALMTLSGLAAGCIIYHLCCKVNKIPPLERRRREAPIHPPFPAVKIQRDLLDEEQPAHEFHPPLHNGDNIDQPIEDFKQVKKKLSSLLTNHYSDKKKRKILRLSSKPSKVCHTRQF